MTAQPQRIADFDSIKHQFNAEIHQARHELGRINIAVFGNTGVGKSTLLNTVFGRELAATGSGSPVTQHIQYHGGSPEPLGIYDTPGFEIGGSTKTLLSEITQVFKDNKKKPLADQIHVAWFVENSQTNRFVDAQSEIVSHLASFGIPVMMILTRVRKLGNGDYPSQTKALADNIIGRQLPLTPHQTVFMVNALADRELGDPAHGLTRLLDATFRAVPESVHEALTAAQQLDLVRKRQAAAKVINRFTFTSGAAGATPIPVADLVLVTTSLARMFARISAAYGIPFKKKQLAQLATAVLLTGGVTHAASKTITRASGKQLAKLVTSQAGRQGGKLVPLANVVVSAAAGTSSALLAKAAGHAWSRVCEYLLTHPDNEPTTMDHIMELFAHQFTRRARIPVTSSSNRTP